jgi:prepilin-type N-terminal cleavage/methylation domain-containing protein
MKNTTGLRHPGAGRGFTLIEVLLALVLVMMFLGALVFSFSSGQQGAELDEGAAQVENLLRFARAHAANVGRQVQLRLEVDDLFDFDMPPGNLLLRWEPDPLGQPGTLETVAEAGSLLQSVNDLVQVEVVKVLDADGVDALEPGEMESTGSAEPVESVVSALSSLAFYPDGSSDSAEIVLCSRSREDARRVVIQLSGITGSIRRLSSTNAEEKLDADSQAKKPDPAEKDGPGPLLPPMSKAKPL